MAKVKLLRVKEVAEMLGIGVSTVWHYVKIGKLPKPIKFGDRAPAWRLSELEEWLEERTRQREESA